MTASDVLRANTEQLVQVLKRELELKEKKLQDDLHFRTLERIFIEERLYKKIEQCRTNEAVLAAVHEGFKPYRQELVRELSNEPKKSSDLQALFISTAHNPNLCIMAIELNR
jgi:topoisomerase IV subunit A